MSCSGDDGGSSGHTPNQAVTTAFATRYPAATDVSWELEGGYSKAEFRLSGMEAEAWFDQQGTWMLTETEMTYAALPDRVKTGFTTSFYSGWTVDEVSKLERNGLTDLYLLEVEQGASDMTLFFDAEGLLVKEVDGSDGPNTPVVVPDKVRDFVDEHYAGAVIVDVEMLPSGVTEVEIIHERIFKEIWLDRQLAWIKTQWEVSPADLPQAVQATLRGEAFAGYTVDDVHYVVYPAGDEMYHVELEKPGSVDMSVNIRPDGQLVLD